MPASPARRRASGVTTAPPASRAGPKFRAGVRTSKNGSSAAGVAGRGCDCAAAMLAGAADARGGATGAFGGAPVAAACGLVTAPALSAITATTAPTGATSPAGTRISAMTPGDVAGTSIETLSVSTSNRFSPGRTASPTDLNQVVILPSATVSPSCGMRTFIPI